MCFAQADRRRNLGQDPAHPRMNNLDGEENCKAAANRLRKIQRAPAARIPLTPARAHAIPRSNASFETKHRPPAAFRELSSWLQRLAQSTRLCENKISASWQNSARRERLINYITVFLQAEARTTNCQVIAGSRSSPWRWSSGCTQWRLRFHVRSR